MSDLIADLEAIVGASGVLQGGDLAPALVDRRGVYRGKAVALVRPRTTREVSDIVKRCAGAGAVIVTQGGNTGMSGGATPTATGPTVIVSLTRMTTIESVDADRQSATVEAGVTIQAIQEAAAAVERLFAPDWGARGTATIGGAVSTNAGGINVLQFGTMREHILGLEVVLADGRVWNGLRALRKDSSGYDLKQLFIGAEGTLGIVTRAVVRLLPAFRHQQSALAALSGLEALGPMFAMARARAHGGLTAFELIPDRGMEAITTKFGRGRPLPTSSEWYALVRFAASEPVTDSLAAFLAEASEAGLVTDAVVAATPDQEENLWLIRDEILPGQVFDNHLSGLKMDTAVPLDRIEAYITGTRALAAQIAPGSIHYAFGHVGDGNLHTYIIPASGDEHAFLGIRPELRDAVDELTWELGGTLSAEHGVGQELRGRIAGQKDATEIDLLHGLKDLLDPGGLFNPDKTLPLRP